MGSSDGSAESVVRRYAAAWAKGEVSTLIDLYADDVVLHYFGQNPLTGDHVGKPAALAVLGRISQLVSRDAPEIHDAFGGGDHGAILARERWHDGDQTWELDRVLLYHVRDGKLSECWVYDQDQRAVDAILSRNKQSP